MPKTNSLTDPLRWLYKFKTPSRAARLLANTPGATYSTSDGSEYEVEAVDNGAGRKYSDVGRIRLTRDAHAIKLEKRATRRAERNEQRNQLLRELVEELSRQLTI